VCLASRLALGDAPVEVGLGGRQVVSLRKDDEVEHMVETPIATAIKAMAHVASGGRLEWCGASVGGELGVCGEAVARSQDRGQAAGGQ